MIHDNAVVILNELLALDPKAIEALVRFRVTCNEELAKHPTVQVRKESGGRYSIGLMGVLNSIFGKNQDGTGKLMYVLENDSVNEFQVNIEEDLSHST